MAQNYTKSVFVLFSNLFAVFPLLLTVLLFEYHAHLQSVNGSPDPFMQLANQMGLPKTLTSIPSAPESGNKTGGGANPFSSFMTPFIPKGGHMKRKKGQSKDYNKKGKETTETVTEAECSNTMFMGPFHDPVYFGINSTFYNRIDKSCKWSFLGTEPCIPLITCATSTLTNGCDKEYLEIVDGVQGYLKVCGGNVQKIEKFTAAGDLRDLYIHFKALKNGGVEPLRNLFSCKVVCSERGQTGNNQLQKGFVPKYNPKCYCGTKPNEDRITGGMNAKKFEFPWLAALVETNTRQPFCGGSIINNRMILTAAHCIKGKFMDYRNIQIVVNGYEFDSSPVDAKEPRTYPLDQLAEMDRKNGSSRHNIEEIMIHELYVPETNDNDIALLRLQDDIDFSGKQPSGANNDSSPPQQPKPICLPELGSYNRTYSNKMATVAGWGLPGFDAAGSTQILQKLDVKVFSPQLCKEMYQHRVNRRMMCAGHREGGRDACSGDSGGPLILEEKPQVWTQIGAVSWGEGCGKKGNPGVYFRITEGLQWLHYNSNFDGWRDDDEEGGPNSRAVWCVTPP